MIIKCLNCGAAVEYDPLFEMMKCKYCNSMFDVGEFSQEEDLENETMECNIYSCTTCGAELAVNGVEASSFCAYCGQPTIVFNRVSQELKPKLIIPFKIPKDYAIYEIRKRFAKGLFVPDEVKNFDVERVCGIYIPYWLFDVYYYDKQIIKTERRKLKTTFTSHCLREAECNFQNLSLDASSNLNDDTTQRLEPYNMRELRPFKIGYLPGYHADRYDMKNTDLYDLAARRIQELFDEQVLRSCTGAGKEIISNDPKMRIQAENYVMLPAWFMTFRYQDHPYTMLVNGQTGKLVGAVPFDKRKAWIIGIFFFVVLALFFIPIACIILLYWPNTDDAIKNMFLYTTIGSGLIFMLGFDKLSCVKHSMKLTTSKTTNRFVHDRQEGR